MASSEKTPMLRQADVKRLLAEMAVADLDPNDWAAREKIDEEVFAYLFEGISQALITASLEGYFSEGGKEYKDGVMVNATDAINSIIGTTFQIGWEAHKQFR